MKIFNYALKSTFLLLPFILFLNDSIPNNAERFKNEIIIFTIVGASVFVALIVVAIILIIRGRK